MDKITLIFVTALSLLTIAFIVLIVWLYNGEVQSRDRCESLNGTYLRREHVCIEVKNIPL